MSQRGFANIDVDRSPQGTFGIAVFTFLMNTAQRFQGVRNGHGISTMISLGILLSCKQQRDACPGLPE